MIPTCKKCGSHVQVLSSFDGVHHAKMICSVCQTFIKWMPKPKNENIRNRTSKHKIKSVREYHTHKKEFCYFCLRTKEQLGKHETLELDHIEELDKGGEDTLENLQILCTACHKLKNWSRLYMNWHKEDDNGTSKNNT